MSAADAWLGIVILLAFGLYLLGGLHALRRRIEKLEDQQRLESEIEVTPGMIAAAEEESVGSGRLGQERPWRDYIADVYRAMERRRLDLPSPTDDQRRYLEQLKKANEKYDPTAIIGSRHKDEVESAADRQEAR